MRRRTLLSGGGGIDPITGRGTIGNYEVVDLGLSNGLLFATCNVGATKEEGYGDYYMYGKGSRKYNYGDSMYQGDEIQLASTADTATVVMGSGWRMPTKDEIQDLINKTTFEWTAINGINGGKLTSKTNPNAYVFFPAAGQYTFGGLYNKDTYGYFWSSTRYDTESAYMFYVLNNNEHMAYYQTLRNCGQPVRGVHAAV